MKSILACLIFFLSYSGHFYEEAPPITIEKKRVRFIINPRSGQGKSQNFEARIARKINQKLYDFDIRLTKQRGDATLFAKEAASQGYDIVVAVGGDGTVHEVGEGLINSSTSLGIIPCGSGNGFARSLKIPCQFDAAFKVLARGRLLNIDTMSINGSPFLGVAGVGFDAQIGQKFADLPKRGPVTYLKLINEELKAYTPKHYSLEVDGKSYETDAFLITFANTNQYGNNLEIDPLAKVDDGTFELVMLSQFPQWAIPELFLRLVGGRINHSPYTETLTCKQVILKGNSHLAHLDGEPIHFQNEMHIQIHPHSLNVVTP